MKNSTCKTRCFGFVFLQISTQNMIPGTSLQQISTADLQQLQQLQQQNPMQQYVFLQAGQVSVTLLTLVYAPIFDHVYYICDVFYRNQDRIGQSSKLRNSQKIMCVKPSIKQYKAIFGNILL